CRSGTILLFPNASIKHVARLGPGPRQGLQALSLCAWLATPASRLGTLLSYTTEDGSSVLAVRGHAGDLSGSVRFIIGNGEFRELPVMPLLDGKWHHLCLTWSSGQGQYRFYVDRRLLAAGSGFQGRALLPGEVASMATGVGLPRGPLLTLADASLQGGVRRVACPCLQHCLR
ncbi:PREDICTED: pentraxin-4, partial [Charadrius vociferus]|uniref:pentraxin-4 n=1 Tax=Charadrius vociferus TaxID=50402 RepID=UPI000521A6CC